MTKRALFEQEHEVLRDSVRRFLAQEVAPYHDGWEEAGQVDREIWRKMGESGFLCPFIAENYGGVGADVRATAVVTEEIARSGFNGLIGISVHDIVANYLLNYGTEAQKNYFLPKACSGEMLLAVAMTEPSAGSDLQGIKSRAVKDDDALVVSGSKIFITNGQLADAVAVVVKTDPDAGAKGTSVLMIEADADGFRRGQNLKKMGMAAQDTSELFFDQVRVPHENVLGGENKGFFMLMEELPFERLLIAITALGAAKGAYQITVDYVNERKAFGKPVAAFQNTRYKLAEMRAEIEIGEAFVDRATRLYCEGQLSSEMASAGKLWLTEMQGRVVDECLQLFGGYGYMQEYPISRFYTDARVQRIYGGTSEIMKELISRKPDLDS